MLPARRARLSAIAGGSPEKSGGGDPFVGALVAGGGAGTTKGGCAGGGMGTAAGA
jgi:hypothetical protein